MALTDPRRDQRRAPGRAEEVTTGFEPDDPPPAAWVTLAVWIGGGVLSLTIYALIAWAIWSLAGCATGRAIYRPDYSVEVVCAAIGEDAEFVYFAPETSGMSVAWTPVQKSVTCKGGAIVPSLLEGVGTVFKALWAILPWAV